MNLFINSPSYYTTEYGVIDEVYSLCNALSKSIDIREYTNVVDTIAITPIIAPIQAYEQDLYKEHKIVSPKTRMADISLRSDYNAFVKADIEGKQRLVLENILRSLSAVKKALKGKFDYEKFEQQVLFVVKDVIVR